ncbi:LuxR C-terminal-related transcriptional regulator [Microbacterium sp. NPDC091662]|uniref:LuxR C-terminal-related transcriptional regulator n=1 Tax=Microbacterium sp. NPDC091662 TaxID=3364211 RepID=UPI00382EE44F
MPCLRFVPDRAQSVPGSYSLTRVHYTRSARSARETSPVWGEEPRRRCYVDRVSSSRAAPQAAVHARFTPPARQGDSVERPRLRAILTSAVARRKLTVVSAPGGYGKTSAVADWAANTDTTVAWITLTRFDNDPLRLASGILSALQAAARRSTDTQYAALLALDPHPTDLGETYHALCETMDELEGPVVLVVDDAQRAGAPQQWGLLDALIDTAPPSLRLVLIGTTLLQMMLSRQLLAEPDSLIGTSDLAFDEKEIESLMPEGPGGMAPGSMLDLTGGWPMAVRVVLLGGARPARTRAFAENPLIREYLNDHVFSQLPSDLTQFILDTTLGVELTPPLAAALSGRADAAAVLEECARRGMFLDRFSDERGPVYRWNSMFARQCRAINESVSPGRTKVLHGIVGVHLVDTDPLAAAHHFLRAEDPAAAYETILNRWVGLLVNSEATALDQLCALFPAGYAADPCLTLIRACAQDVLGQHESARMLLGEVAASDQSTSTPDYRTVLAVARLFLLQERREVGAALDEMSALLVENTGRFHRDRAALLYVLGWAHMRQRSRPQRIIELFTAAIREAQIRGEEELVLRERAHLALTLGWAGRMTEARALLPLLGDRMESPESPWTYYAGGSGGLTAAYAAYWSNDLDEAMTQSLRVIHSGSTALSLAGVARIFYGLAAAASREPAHLRMAALQMQSLPGNETYGWSWPMFRRMLTALLEEAGGRRDRAVAIVSRAGDISRLPLVTVSFAGILRRSGDPVSAVALLRNAREHVDISYVRVAMLTTEALLHRRRSETGLMHDLCERALEIAASEDIRRPFCDGELELRQLLTEHISRGTQFEDFIALCLRSRTEGSPLESLSPRERDVLDQLRTTRTMPEIAARLGISLNTLKTHQRGVYRKLGVVSRREAIRFFA